MVAEDFCTVLYIEYLLHLTECKEWDFRHHDNGVNQVVVSADAITWGNELSFKYSKFRN